MIIHLKTRYIDCERAKLVISKYLTNGATALSFQNADSFEPLCRATVNLIEIDNLPPTQVFIKSWSENEGMAEALMKAKIIGPVLETVSTGFVRATRHDLLVPPTPNH